MSYIIKSTSPFVSIKLTEMGREKLALGKLNFKHWAIGDSELNYNRESIVDSNQMDVALSGSSAIMRPMDVQPNIKYFITPRGSATPFQPINSSVLNVVKAVVNNKATERGFFENNGVYETKITDFTIYTQEISNINFTGTNVVPLTSTTNISIGDWVLLKVTNDVVNTILVDDTTMALPNLWFQVTAVNVGSIELDRPTPDLTTETTSKSQLIVYKGGEVYNTLGAVSNIAYWDSGTLSFNSNVNVNCSDVPVWNMNNVWNENIGGVDTRINEDFNKYGSQRYLGFKTPYTDFEETPSINISQQKPMSYGCNGPSVSYPDDFNKSSSIIHYTNNTISNLYGEFIYTDVENGKYFSLSIPNLMYHRADRDIEMGMKFIATGETKTIEKTEIEYIDLVESSDFIMAGEEPRIVGRVYPQMKICEITDDEINAATSFKTNRNWTLPELTATVVNTSGTGVLNANETMYLTYILGNETDGLATALQCQTYTKLTNNTNSMKDVSFKINGVDQLQFMRKIEAGGYDGLGFYAKTFKLVYQTVQDPNERPSPNGWMEVDFTTTTITGNPGETIDPLLLENQAGGFLFNASSITTPFNISTDLNLPLNSALSEELQFGDERFFYGNIETYIGATIFKTIFDIRVNASQFNSTSNPTRSKDLSTNPSVIKITEVGIYDSDKNLVCIGKLSTPVPLSSGNTIMLELSMDF